MEVPDNFDDVKALLLGRRVIKVDDSTLLLDDGRHLRIYGNEGCGGCPSGAYDIDFINECPINAIMDVQLEIEGSGREEDEQRYRLFVLAQDERIELVRATGSDGNGYYGSGFWIEVIGA